MECCLNGDPNHSCHEGGCAGDPLLWYHAVLQRARTVTPGQRMGRLGSVLGSLSPPPVLPAPPRAQLSQQCCQPTALPAHSPMHLSSHPPWASLPCGTSQHGPREPHVLAWPQLSLPLPCPSAQLCRLPTLCFFPQTMLTAISMSAIATNGVVPGKAKPVSTRVPRVWAAGRCGAGCLQGLFPGSIPLAASRSPAFCHQPARDPHGPGERGAGAATRPQSREVQMAARAASRGSSLRQTGEAAGSRETHGRRMGAGRAGCHGLGDGVGSPTAGHGDAAVCGLCPPGRRRGVWPVGALAASPRTCQPCRALGSCELRQAGHITDSPTRGVIKAIYHPAAAAGPSILAAQL